MYETCGYRNVDVIKMDWPDDILTIIFDYKYEFEARERRDQHEREFLYFFDMILHNMGFNHPFLPLI